jgi:hypothetical protein
VDGGSALIHAGQIVCRSCLLMELLSNGSRLRVRVRRRKLIREIRRAFLALLRTVVPADVWANLRPAARTLPEVLLSLLNGRAQSPVVCAASDSTLNLIGGMTD